MTTPTGPGPNPQLLMYARDLKRVQQLRRVYESLVPSPLDASSPDPPNPVVRTATAFFTDLRGFTRLGEQFADDPAGLLAVINEHLAVVVDAVVRCGGVVEKFIGDSVFATFGARSDQPDHTTRALAAGLGAVRANEALTRRRASAWGFRLEVGVGIATGKLVVGSIGPRRRSELGILGDPVNIAARLVGKAGAGEVLFAAHATGDVAGIVQTESLGSSAIRGRTQAVDICRIALRDTRRE